jgi:hypothetical protein
MLAFAANVTLTGSTKKDSGGTEIEKRIRMSVSDQTSNYNQTSDEQVSDHRYKAYPKIGPFPVNDLCLEDNGATIRTILPVRGICAENKNCDDDGVMAGTETAYLTVPANEAMATCTDSQNMSDGARVCRRFDFTPALRSYKVDEEVLTVNGQDDQTLQKTGNQSTYSIQACPHS